MSFRKCLAFPLSLVVLLAVVPVRAEDRQLDDAKTMADVIAYLSQEWVRVPPPNLSQKNTFLAPANLFMSASEKLREIASEDAEMISAYSMKLQAFQFQVMAEVEGAEQKREAFVNEMAASDLPDARNLAVLFRFNQFAEKTAQGQGSPENFAQFMSELKPWLNQKALPASIPVSFGLQIAQRNRVSAETFIEELTKFVQSPECTLTAEEKVQAMVAMEAPFRLSVGKNPKLYGKTLDDKDFKWDDLRGKYVLIKFTATWCGPCKGEIPGMLEAYKKYHDQGLEIVSVYIGERGTDEEQIEGVQKAVEEEKLPWIILSETLTAKAEQPEQGEFYSIRGVPTMVLVDKEGKIIMPDARGADLQKKLAEVFK